jgi:hypothetical protein
MKTNNSNSFLRLDGFMIYDRDSAKTDSTLRFTFPEKTILAPKKAILIFGGGILGDYKGTLALKANNGLNLNNDDDTVLIKDKNKKTINKFDIYPLSNNPDESYTRKPDITGPEPFVQHADVVVGKLFSPGTKIDGSSF